MNLKFTTLMMLATGLALTACSTKDGGDDTGSPVGDGGTTTTGGDAGTTTTGDAGTTTTTGGDTGIALMYWNGSAAVTPGASYDGYEDLYTTLYTGEDFCTIEYSVSGTANNDCAECDWAFDLVGADDGADNGGMGCAWLIDAYGLTSAADIGAGSEFSYGYSSDYYGYETMFYDYYGYGWYGVYYATAAYDGATFDYSWYSGGFYFYWDEL